MTISPRPPAATETPPVSTTATSTSRPAGRPTDPDRLAASRDSVTSDASVNPYVSMSGAPNRARSSPLTRSGRWDAEERMKRKDGEKTCSRRSTPYARMA